MTIAGYEITDDEFRALAFMVVDPVEWITHAATIKRGDKAIAHKIQRALALVADVPDEEYTTRAERDATAEAEMQPTAEQLALGRELAQAKLGADLAAAKGAGLPLAVAHLEEQVAELTTFAKSL